MARSHQQVRFGLSRGLLSTRKLITVVQSSADLYAPNCAKAAKCRKPGEIVPNTSCGGYDTSRSAPGRTANGDDHPRAAPAQSLILAKFGDDCSRTTTCAADSAKIIRRAGPLEKETMKSKPKTIEVRCPKCGWPIICKEGDRCYCG